MSVVGIADLHGGLSPGNARVGTEPRELRPDFVAFQATRTVKRKPAPIVEIADESVDCVVARLVN
jgi:hypothetical protein